MPTNPVRPASGQIIASDWGDSVADMVVRRYANAGARDADLAGKTSADLLGQIVVLTGTGELQQYVGPVQQWRPPWNVPWGLCPGGGPFSSSLDVTGTASFQTILSTKPSVNLYAGRSYRILANGTVISSGNSQLNIVTPAGSVIARIFAFGSTEGSFTCLFPFAQASTLLAQTIDFGIVGVGISSKGSMALHRIVVEDIGPGVSTPTALEVVDGIEQVNVSLLPAAEQEQWLAQQESQAQLMAEVA
jgi:hypothetical protein